MTQPYDLGPAITTPHGVDRSLLAHCLTLANKTGWAVEFGVGKGESLRMIAKTLRCVAFDSFEGLPVDWRPEFPKGSFAHPQPAPIPGVTIVPGWFVDTVPFYDWPQGAISLVHIDSDTYESAVTVLASIGPFLHDGTIVVFDEFHGFDDDHSGHIPGEQRAWTEYLQGDLLTYDTIGHGREQWAIRITGRNA